jgi:hypothetical protein
MIGAPAQHRAYGLLDSVKVDPDIAGPDREDERP